MTEKEYIEKHREKWNRIIEEYSNGNLLPLYELEPDILESMGENPVHYSFACEYAGEECEFCPIVKKCGVCRYRGSIHDKLYKAVMYEDKTEAVRLATIIRDAWE